MTTEPRTVRVRRTGGAEQACPAGTAVAALLGADRAANGLPYVGARVNHDVVSLSFPVEVDSTVEPLTLGDHHGYPIFRRSVCFLLAKAVHELFPDARLSVEHSLGTGFYCAFERGDRRAIAPAELAAIAGRMEEQVRDNLPIERSKIAFADAVRRFRDQGQSDKYNLLRFRNPPSVTVYSCGGFTVLAHGVLAPSTAALGRFRLEPYPPGFVVQFPERESPLEVAPFQEQPHLFQVFQEHKRWGRILGLSTVGELNETIAGRRIAEFIRIAEALHEKKIARIADEIHARRERVRMVLIAGPSSAGKTTLTKRLGVQLKVNGLRPVAISVDDYFVDREQTPRDGQGEFDFEHIEAIDLDLFNRHLDRLDRGEEIEVPRFNFASGRRAGPTHPLRLDEDQILIVEGIHALNPRLTAGVENSHKYRIYISALGQLNLDRNNRLSTTDNRLVRRMVRDNAFRGYPALTTLRRWPSVRRGEKTWIFPFQQEADIAFNSALDYELAVLKPLAEPLLAEVKPDQPEYADARRLQAALACFLVAPEELVPPTSILREYIGKSAFEY